MRWHRWSPDGEGQRARINQDLGSRTPGCGVEGHPLAGSRAPHALGLLDGRSVSTLDLFGDHLAVLTGAYADPEPVHRTFGG